MPAAYAHNRFGSACIETMPEKFKAACLAYRDLFDFGVHGPDIFFYYDPFSKNKVNTFGSDMHRRSGKDFFASTREVFFAGENKAAMMAYLLGFLAHFTLDSSCHAYINGLAADESKGMSHNYIESQYEALLMRQDEREAVKVDRSESLHPTRYTASVIARFFPLTEVEVLKSIKGQQSTLHLLYSPTEQKKKLLRACVQKFRIPGNFDDLFIDAVEDAACKESNAVIRDLQQQALVRFPELMKNYINFIYGHEELIGYFDHDFEGEMAI